MWICCPDWRLEALLSDDLIQTMMRADNIDPDKVRALFATLATSKHMGVTAGPAVSGLHET
jgi:hypothetical protein